MPLSLSCRRLLRLVKRGAVCWSIAGWEVEGGRGHKPVREVPARGGAGCVARGEVAPGGLGWAPVHYTVPYVFAQGRPGGCVLSQLLGSHKEWHPTAPTGVPSEHLHATGHVDSVQELCEI